MSFTGEYRAKLNAKNQVTLPSPLRDALFALEAHHPLIIFSRQDDGSFLELYTAPEWSVIQQKTEVLARQQKTPGLNRTLNARAYPVALEENGNGRILIPQVYAGIFKPADDIVFIGNTKKIELWNARAYDKQLAENKSSFHSALEDIFEY